MRRAVARGRIVPQSLSTDPRVGRLSLKAALLFPLMWINSDDQGRISGDPSEVKYVACPNIDHITKEDIPELLKELQTQELIKLYSTSKINAIQMLDWWEVQRLQWAYPSQYPPPEGWTDHLRYHPTPKEIITENWPSSGQLANELLPSKLPSQPASALPSELANSLGKDQGRAKGKKTKSRRHPLPSPEIKKEKEGGNRRGRGNLPSALGSPSPSLTGLSLFNCLQEKFAHGFGRLANTREMAQLRDLGEEISSASGATIEQVHDAFSEAAGQNKMHISYVRAILLDWLGIARGPP